VCSITMLKSVFAVNGGNALKQIMRLLLLLLLLTALAAFYSQGWDQGMLLVVIFAFSAKAYILTENFRRDADRETYDRQMKNVQTFTIVCAFISFYWPESMFPNAAIFFCLLFHVAVGRYVKQFE